ncbi:unnamed protein product, partial [Darwinula stevensoni]
MERVAASIVFAFVLLLLPSGSLEGSSTAASCPDTAPSRLTLTTTPCGRSSSVSTSRTWLNLVWNNFLSFMMGNTGLARQSDLIYGGSPATITEAPFMAHVDAQFPSGKVGGCSASIISEYRILTAAHCVVDEN